MKKIAVLVGILFMVGLGSAHATMTEFVTFTANGAGISVDAKGLPDNTEGTIRAFIPAGSTVQQAFLYSATVGFSSQADIDVIFNGTTLSAAGNRLDLGVKDANTWVRENRWDVTSIVQGVVGSGNGLFNFTLKETGFLDGEVLAVLFSDPTKPVSTAFILDGELSTTGDSFSINLGTAVDKTNPNFAANLSIGDSFGFQDNENPANQDSQITVNGQRMTSSAGGEDDGFGANGGLITAGGIDDSNTNPADPFSQAIPVGSTPSFRYDDELYSLIPFLNNGDTVINFSTINPSNDDNIFFTAFTTLGEASIGPPSGEVPEPATMILIGSGLAGAALYRRLRKPRG